MGGHLEMVCNSYLKWQVRKSLFTYNTLVGWATASGHMMRDGAFRTTRLLQRMAAGEMPFSADVGRVNKGGDTGLQGRVVQLGAVVFAFSLIIVITGERVQFGVNLFTAEVVFIASAAMMLLRTFRRLSETG